MGAGVGKDVVGFDGNAFAFTGGNDVIASEGFLDFAFAEKGTQFGRDNLAEVVGVVLLIMGCCLLLNACMATTYGKSFISDPEDANRYTLTVYIGGLAGQETADSAAAKEIAAFMSRERFASYEIVARTHDTLNHSYEYQVRFSTAPDTYYFRK